MTATDELRKLLDERGVEWKARPDGVTEWVNDGMTCKAVDRTTVGIEHLTMLIPVLTPEQAIAATLGAGTCKNKATSLRTFWCDCCDCALEDWMDVGGKLASGMRYCPNCGRKVEG